MKDRKFELLNNIIHDWHQFLPQIKINRINIQTELG